MDRESLIDSGWSRGSVIDLSIDENLSLINNLPIKVQAYIADKKAYAIISLYDCALVHSSLESEPWFYIFIATEIDKLNGSFSYGKNERRLNFELQTPECDIFLETNALTCNLNIDREILSQLMFSSILASKELEVALNWISDRITRPVFTDEFNTDVKSKAEKVFKDIRMESISSVYLKETVFEGKTKNEVKVFLTVPQEIGRPKYKKLSTEKQNGETIEERMNAIFPLNKYRATTLLIPEAEISIAMLKDYKKWSPDYFSDRVNKEDTEKTTFKNQSF
ncbi:hypothetical protein [Colwellia sp. Arc7-D]|uniref:hypothetical protein n=1 Tax=Colwellia sp. Arc7-D TaxID=2161872 RepID=UPI000D380174|nr:hypothetical protein [Colwellia sp. Arc7-D]AWB56858.1 hypothetical protein DBO93_04290 [Colwellia sp. Arc7-D]